MPMTKSSRNISPKSPSALSTMIQKRSTSLRMVRDTLMASLPHVGGREAALRKMAIMAFSNCCSTLYIDMQKVYTIFGISRISNPRSYFRRAVGAWPTRAWRDSDQHLAVAFLSCAPSAASIRKTWPAHIGNSLTAMRLPVSCRRPGISSKQSDCVRHGEISKTVP